MTHEEEVKIQNYKEHFNSIQGNISIANHRLESILKEEKDAALRLDSIKKELASVTDRLASIYDGAERIKAQQVAREANIQKLLKDLDWERAEFTIWADTEHQILDDAHAMQEIRRISVQQEIDRLEGKRAKLETHINELNNLRDSLEKGYEKSHKESTRELAQIENQIHEKQEYFTKEIARLKKIKDILELQTQNILAANIERAQVIEEREKAVAQRERDADIIAARWQKWHRELFPEGKLKI